MSEALILDNAETKEGIPKSLELAQILENTDDDFEIKEKIGVLLDHIKDDLGVSIESNPNVFYEKMRQEKCLVRAEKLSRVLETVELKVPLVISDESETHYANAVLPLLEGIKIALSEGRAPGPIKAVVGFGKTIIGFNPENLKVEEIEFSESDIRDKDERKYLCRHVTGELQPEDIRHVVLRIPSAMVSEERLEKNEKAKKAPFVFRCFSM